MNGTRLELLPTTPLALRLLALPVFLALTLIWPSSPALALDRAGYSIQLLVDGAPLEEHPARGTTYVEALEGREYSIRVTNRTGQRVAVALAVDGLNSIDARSTSAAEAAKWILEPWGSITLDGWQTSSSTARRFFFTTEKDSYGAWLGQTQNLGVISAVVFRERVPKPIPILHDESPRAPAREQGARARDARPAPQSKADAAQGLSDDLVATGIGREVEHRVRRVELDLERHPAARLDLRYEYRDALVKLGVVPRRGPACGDDLARRERSRGFSDGDFAPDPFRR